MYTCIHKHIYSYIPTYIQACTPAYIHPHQQLGPRQTWQKYRHTYLYEHRKHICRHTGTESHITAYTHGYMDTVINEHTYMHSSYMQRRDLGIGPLGRHSTFFLTRRDLHVEEFFTRPQQRQEGHPSRQRRPGTGPLLCECLALHDIVTSLSGG